MSKGNIVTSFDVFNESKLNQNKHEIYQDLISKNDAEFYAEYKTKSASDIKKIRTEYKKMRIEALEKMNKELNGKIMNIDASDSDLYPYVSNKDLFLKYARILDFVDGYKPTNESKEEKNFLVKDLYHSSKKTQKSLVSVMNLTKNNSNLA